MIFRVLEEYNELFTSRRDLSIRGFQNLKSSAIRFLDQEPGNGSRSGRLDPSDFAPAVTWLSALAKKAGFGELIKAHSQAVFNIRAFSTI